MNSAICSIIFGAITLPLAGLSMWWTAMVMTHDQGENDFAGIVNMAVMVFLFTATIVLCIVTHLLGLVGLREPDARRLSMVGISLSWVAVAMILGGCCWGLLSPDSQHRAGPLHHRHPADSIVQVSFF